MRLYVGNNSVDATYYGNNNIKRTILYQGGAEFTVTGASPLTLPSALPNSMYKLVQRSGCEQASAPSPSAPVDIKCNNGTLVYQSNNLVVNGTAEVLYVTGKNLNSGTLDHVGYTSTGGTSTSTTFAGTLCQIPTKEGEKFTVSCGNITDGISGVFINTWLEDGSWNTRQAIAATGGILTYTVGAGVGLINFTLYKTGGVELTSNSWMQVEYGTTATQYVPYIPPRMIQVNSLFSAGSYTDEQNIASGNIIRRAGIKVFNGTESFFASGDGWAVGISDKLKSKVAVLCSHYEYSSATMTNAPDKSILTFSSQNIGFKDSAFTSATDVGDFFAAQYANGTPVIVVYPLGEETTESVGAQEVCTNAGTNSVKAVANVSDITLDVIYLKET